MLSFGERHYANGSVTCIRSTTEGTEVAFQRPLAGSMVCGDGFTLIVQSLSPMDSCLIIHEPCALLQALLCEHGVQRIHMDYIGSSAGPH